MGAADQPPETSGWRAEDVDAPSTRVIPARGAAGRRVLRNTVFLVAGDATSKLGLFVLYAVIARALGKGGFGDYTLAISLAFFVRAATLGADVVLSREVARDLENVHGLFWQTTALKLAAGTAVLAGVGVFAVASGYPTELTAAVLLIGLSNVIDVGAFSLHAVLRGREQMGAPAKALALETSVVVCLGTVAILVLDGGLAALGVSYVIAALVALVYIHIALRRHGIRPRRRGSTRGIRWLARAAVPLGIANFFGIALGRLDAVILSVMTHDSGIVGLYGGAYRIFEATLFVSWAFGLAILPMLSTGRRQSRLLRNTFELSCKAITAATMPVAGVMALFGPTIVKAVLGAGFAGGGTATRILGGTTLLYGIFTVATLAVAGQDRQGSFPWMMGVALTANVVLNIILIPSLSLNGAAIAMTAAQGVATALMVWFAVRETGAVSPIRMFAGSLVGLVAMTVPALVLGSGVAALVLSLAAYGLVFLTVERLCYRDDLELFRSAISKRRSAADPPGAAAGVMAARSKTTVEHS